ncbi:hypothetical protein D3C87_1693500 [compost metagenome]
MNGEDRLPGLEQVMDHDLAERRERLPEAIGNLLDLVEQLALLGRAGLHAGHFVQQ